MPARHRAIISWHWLRRGPLSDGRWCHNRSRGAGRPGWPGRPFRCHHGSEAQMATNEGGIEFMSTTTASAGGVNELKRNVLGLPSAMVMSIAFISPTIGVIFISALIGGQA